MVRLQNGREVSWTEEDIQFLRDVSALRAKGLTYGDMAAEMTDPNTGEIGMRNGTMVSKISRLGVKFNRVHQLIFSATEEPVELPDEDRENAA